MTDRVPLKEDPTPAETNLTGIKQALESRGEARFDDTVSFMDDPDYHRLADFLDVPFDDRKDSKMAERLSFLFDWAKTYTKSDERITKLEAIRGLQRQLGIQKTGPETIKKLVQYVRLSSDISQKEREIDLIRGDGVL